MVDGAVILVDAAEGPMPQTKFVLSKALKIGLKPIVAINKIDRPDQRAEKVLDEIFDLFVALDANAEQLDFPVLYGSAKEGWMASEPSGPKDGMAPLFSGILEHVPPPTVVDGSFRLLATTLEANPYLGRILTGRIVSGSVAPNMSIKALTRDGKVAERGRVSKVLAFRGLERQPITQGTAGDIVAIAGLARATVADTLCALDVVTPFAAQPIDPPTLSMTFRINDGPLAGTEGDRVQGRVIRERLLREAEGNVALRVTEAGDNDAMVVAGRGELQLAILIETMRREGFELCVARPRVVYRTTESGQRLEPIEEVTIDVDEEHTGAVVKKLAERRADLLEMKPSGGGRVRLVFHAPTRGLIGYQSELLSDTSGTAVLNRVLPRLHALSRRYCRPQQRRSDFQQRRRVGCLRPMEPRRPRPHADRAGGTRLSRYDRRRAHQGQRHGSQCYQGQAADQCARCGQGRGRAADPAHPHVARACAGLYRR